MSSSRSSSPKVTMSRRGAPLRHADCRLYAGSCSLMRSPASGFSDALRLLTATRGALPPFLTSCARHAPASTEHRQSSISSTPCTTRRTTEPSSSRVSGYISRHSSRPTSYVTSTGRVALSRKTRPWRRTCPHRGVSPDVLRGELPNTCVRLEALQPDAPEGH